MHCLNGLNDKFDGIHNVIRHRSPFPSFHTARSMLLAEEERLNKHVKPAIAQSDTTSSPNVLFVDSKSNSSGSQNQSYNNNNNRGSHNRNNRNRGGTKQ